MPVYTLDSIEQIINAPIDEEVLEQVISKYKKYLEDECQMRLFGMPADMETMLKVIELKKLFVPLRFANIPKKWNSIIEDTVKNEQYIDDSGFWRGYETPIAKEGRIRAVIFSGPGGGKTTWVRRLLSAYGLKKIDEINDLLPERELFPIIVKCREIIEGFEWPLLEQIEKIMIRPDKGFDSRMVQVFMQHVLQHIKNESALFIFDGLDEISVEKKRQDFLDQLKEFIENHPEINIVLTSRNVGYKKITENKLSDYDFTHSLIIPFNDDEIRRFCLDWHKIVTPYTPKDQENAQRLSDIIISHDRIRALCKTPVLLTTLMLVNHRIGTLPFRRAELYYEAVKLLLATWNTHAHPPLDLRNVIPHLAFLAHHMMFYSYTPKQTIGKTELKKVLTKAREFLRAYELSETVEEFVQAIEDRSALLVVRGITSVGEESRQEEEYEFQHLTYQEYFCAYAIVNKHYLGATAKSTISESFKGSWIYPEYRECILLASAMTNQWTGEEIPLGIIGELRHIEQKRSAYHVDNTVYLKKLLLQIIVDGAVLSDEGRKQIYEACFVSEVYNSLFKEEFRSIYETKQGGAFLKQTLKELDNERRTPLYDDRFIPTMDLYMKGNSDFYKRYMNNRHTEKHLESVKMLDIAVWIGCVDPMPKFKQKEKVKEALLEDILNGDLPLQRASLSTLSIMYGENNSIFSRKLMEVLCQIFSDDSKFNISRCSKNFPISKDTVIWLEEQEFLSQESKNEIKYLLYQSKDHLDLLGYFWFGVLNGVWDMGNTILLAKGFHDANDCLKADVKKALFVKMREYIVTVFEAGVLKPHEDSIALKYLEEVGNSLGEKKEPASSLQSYLALPYIFDSEDDKLSTNMSSVESTKSLYTWETLDYIKHENPIIWI